MTDYFGHKKLISI